MKSFYILNLLYGVGINGYVHMNTLKMNLINNIKQDEIIKKDFKQLNNESSYELISYWHDEIRRASYFRYDLDTTNMNYLYDLEEDNSLNEYRSKNLKNLTNIKYNLLFDKKNDTSWIVWRPNIEICLSRLCLYDMTYKVMHNTLLYPSIREYIYLIEIDMSSRTKPVIIKNILKNPYWYNERYDCLDILQESLDKYFISYLKYLNIIFL